MFKSKLLIFILLLILLGVGYYNQGEPSSQKTIDKPLKNQVVAEDQKQLGLNPKFKPVQDRKPGEIYSQNFEEILKQASEISKVEAIEDTGNARNANQAASGVVVGPNGGQLEVYGGTKQENSGTGSAELDALREAADLYNSNSGSSLIPGARVSGPSKLSDVVQEAVAQPTSTPLNNVLREVTGQARGYTMLYLMHPKAKQTVEKQIEAMLRSKVQQLYIGVLTDGTFGKDFNYLSSIVRRIARERRSLVLTIYLTNGSTMREQTGVEAPFADIGAINFREEIRFNRTVREQYVDLIRPVIPVLQLNRRLNQSNRNFVSVMLEDNLDDASYLAMRSLAEPLIGNRATFIRNPCGGDGCPDGSTTDGLGDPIETHILEELNELGIRDAFSFDGIGYRLPGETEERIPSYEDAKTAALTAISRGIAYFALWRFERQGNKFGEAPKKVDDRTFEVPSEAAINAEIELLRAGLTPVEEG